jgi:hypothetical protein
VRRFAPWLLLGLLTLGVAAGAASGVAGQSPSLSARAQIARIIAATRSAPSARFSYSLVTTSKSPFLRSSGSGTGEVDFTTNSLRVSERQRGTEWVGVGDAPARPVTQTTRTSEIQIGRTGYRQLSTGINVLGARWIKVATFPVGSLGAFGALGQISPLDTLAMNASVRGLQVHDLGQATIAGRATTKFLFSLPTCLAVAKGHGVRSMIAPTEVWVDGRDRLVQATDVMREDVSKNAFAGIAAAVHFPAGRSTTVTTVRLYDFDAHVSITAPRVTPLGSSSGGGEISARRNGCSS